MKKLLLSVLFAAVTSGLSAQAPWTHGPLRVAPDGRSFTLQTGAIPGDTLRVSWFNPRTGETTAADTMAKAGSATFDPPGESAPGNDWVLILDDAAREYRAPATP